MSLAPRQPSIAKPDYAVGRDQKEDHISDNSTTLEKRPKPVDLKREPDFILSCIYQG